MTTLVKGHAEGKLKQRLAQLAKPKLLIMDEFGYLPLEAAAAHLLFQLVSRRYERGSILITSNRAVGDWGAVLGDQVVATAILDRLLHPRFAAMLNIETDRYGSYERGDREPPLEVLATLRRVTGVSLDELIGYGDHDVLTSHQPSARIISAGFGPHIRGSTGRPAQITGQDQ